MIDADNHESKVEDGPACFGTESLVPKGLADPVSECGWVAFGYIREAYGADEMCVPYIRYRERHPVTGLERFLMLGDPILCHPIKIGMGDIDGRGGNGPVSGQTLDFGRITKAKRSQDQPLGFEGRDRQGSRDLQEVTIIDLSPTCHCYVFTKKLTSARKITSVSDGRQAGWGEVIQVHVVCRRSRVL
jgi:hypothetical protein